MKKTEFQDFIEQKIPLAKNMQVQFQKLSAKKVILQVPLQPNLNHKGTAFGGSQFAACALACYGLVWALVEESGQHTDNIVIAESQIKYLRPVGSDFTVEVNLVDAQKYIESWKSSVKAKFELKARVLVNEQICTEMTGVFVLKI